MFREVVFACAVLVAAPSAWASPDFTKIHRKKCVYCHQDGSWTSGKLTPAGKYFLEHGRSFKGFVESPVPAHGATQALPGHPRAK